MLEQTNNNQNSPREVVTRFAPSPTGLLHAGNYRTALFAYIFAQQHKGTFILRIEDTDKARSKKEYEDNILESLKWLGLPHDAFFRQSERSEVHASYIQKLIDSGHAYVSKETPKEPGDRDEVIRFRNPNKKVTWNDLIRGTITFDTTDLKDFIIARSMSEPVFHLVVVTDDHDSGVTHIIRGEDHISNTPRHILIAEALGFDIPTYAHLPLLLSPDRSKLSKRKGALPITEYRDRGYLPEAIINYLALLGWNPGTNQEIMSIDELIQQFDVSKIQKSGAIFNEEKLKWVNKHYLAKLTDLEFIEKMRPFVESKVGTKLSPRLLPLIREKVSTFSEIPDLFLPTGELGFVMRDFSTTVPYPPQAIVWKQETDMTQTLIHLKRVIDDITPIQLDRFTKDTTRAALWPYAEATGKGNVLWPMRYALSGADRSPDPFILADILGKEETIRRLNLAHHALSQFISEKK